MTAPVFARYAGPVRCGRDVIVFGRLDQCGEPARWVEHSDECDTYYCRRCAQRELFARDLQPEVLR